MVGTKLILHLSQKLADDFLNLDVVEHIPFAFNLSFKVNVVFDAHSSIESFVQFFLEFVCSAITTDPRVYYVDQVTPNFSFDDFILQSVQRSFAPGVLFRLSLI